MNQDYKNYGLLGASLGYSLSPKMHNAALAKFQIKGNYSLFEKEPDQVEDFLKNLGKEAIAGLNVTVPYKEKVLQHLDWVSEDAARIGAVNTILVEANNLRGYNTDWFGFLTQLKKFIDPNKKRVALLGAGGAGRAVAYALVKEAVSQLVIFDLDLERAEQLVAKSKELGKKNLLPTSVEVTNSIKGLDLANKDLLINATPVGLRESDPLLVDKDNLSPGLVVYDLIYNPPLTRLLAAAKERGLGYLNGLEMLIYQGAQAFLYFTGFRNELDEVASVMKSALEVK